jgi:predicted CoA-binding protein
MHANPDAEQIKYLLQDARTVAVVGLSDRPYRPATRSHAPSKASDSNFPVNPNLTGPVLGEEPYAKVEEIPNRST